MPYIVHFPLDFLMFRTHFLNTTSGNSTSLSVFIHRGTAFMVIVYSFVVIWCNNIGLVHVIDSEELLLW